MRTVHISSAVMDPDGHVTIDALPDSDLASHTRRVNRVATLDGGAAINDFGFSHADRTFVVVWLPNPRIDAAVGRLVRLYSRLIVSMRDGVYLCAIEAFRPTPRESRLTLLVIERRDAGI